jgi:hypothetical protein
MKHRQQAVPSELEIAVDVAKVTARHARQNAATLQSQLADLVTVAQRSQRHASAIIDIVAQMRRALMFAQASARAYGQMATAKTLDQYLAASEKYMTEMGRIERVVDLGGADPLDQRPQRWN